MGFGIVCLDCLDYAFAICACDVFQIFSRSAALCGICAARSTYCPCSSTSSCDVCMLPRHGAHGLPACMHARARAQYVTRMCVDLGVRPEELTTPFTTSGACIMSEHLMVGSAWALAPSGEGACFPDVRPPATHKEEGFRTFVPTTASVPVCRPLSLHGPPSIHQAARIEQQATH